MREGSTPAGARPREAGGAHGRNKWARNAAAACLVLDLILGPLRAPVAATVFHSRQEALELAFPDADRVETRDFFLTPAQRSEIEAHARTPLDSNLITVYVGHRGEETSGYAILDTHVVRTLPETFLIVMSPGGAIVATHILAFYEPREYLPAERWLQQFDGKQLDADLQVGRSIAAITGSTLTSRAVASAVRRALAIQRVLLAGS